MSNSRILAGMRVVEASAFVAAPLGGMSLAQMGADVIRIDPLQGGLDHRRWPVTPDDTSLFWCGLNKSKRSVALDTASAEGRELAAAIICAPGPDAGLFVTNFPPRGWLAYEDLSRRRPDLIQLTIQGDRQGGSAVDYTVNCAIGLPYLTGHGAGDDVVNHVLPAWDLVTGQMAATGLLAAERQRTRTGLGQHVKLALEDVALACAGHLGLVAEAQLGAERPRHGNYLFGAFGRDFVCADGVRIMLVALTSKQWRTMCQAMQMEEAVAQLGARLGLDLDREGDRFRAREDIAGIVARWCAATPFAQARAAFDRLGVCWGRYQTVRQRVAAESDKVRAGAASVFSEVDQPGVGRYLMPGQPLRFGAAEEAQTCAAPRLGQHTQEVLAEVLGLTAGEIGRLHDKGVIAAPVN
ncbi:Succinyl-CoA:(R)-benzylsuccinate CoA-transferase subunit BbsF (plasmid) [Variovorax sp. SRS16]|uniref:CoA transferase n=1 Tax=Variovorax sp. SRS16 TaxID=282217 RepID=UPI0013172A70|nr:CoA transferase [Variovorax sp. SRS16]VTU45553.1 Succinyl-CoA:(R)-benzylsuccinate CoA-transferase subunit BbsF [Variovorax sp. SRS16]